MANVSVAGAQPDDVLMHSEMPTAVVARSGPILPRLLIALWAVIVLATGAFLLLGSLRIGAGNTKGRRMPVREIWSRFLDYLGDQGASAGLVMAVVAMVGITLVSAALALWLAFGVKDAGPEPAAEESAGK